jgi:hypothetical protein
VEAGRSNGDIRKMLNSEDGQSNIRMRHIDLLTEDLRVLSGDMSSKAKFINAKSAASSIPEGTEGGNVVPGSDVRYIRAAQEQFSSAEVEPYLRMITPPSLLDIPGVPFPRPNPPPENDGSGPFSVERPTREDRRFAEEIDGLASRAPFGGYLQAARHLRHFREATGTVLVPDVGGMLRQARGFARAVDSQAVNQLYPLIRHEVARRYNGRSQTFTLSTPWLPFQAERGSDWYYAMGSWDYAHTARVTMTPARNGRVQVRVEQHLRVYDRYNWDVKKQVTIPYILGDVTITDQRMGRLHTTGLGREYIIRGSLRRGAGNYNIADPRSGRR